MHGGALFLCRRGARGIGPHAARRMTWIWIPITIAAALSQNLRTAMQKHLKGRLSTNGANYTRYAFGLPFAIGYALLLHHGLGFSWPSPDAAFLGWVLLGGVSQILATSLLIETMTRRNFAAGVAYAKTEVVQAALFEAVFLGLAITVGGALAIALATIGVMLVSLRASADPWREFLVGWTDQVALLGLASGGLFAVSAVAFRAASIGREVQETRAARGARLARDKPVATPRAHAEVALEHIGGRA